MLNKEEFGRRIAFFRKEKNITQRELAEMLNISYQAVSKWESGKGLPTIEMLYEISNILDVTTDELLNEIEWKDRSTLYKQSGLNKKKLYSLKGEIMKLNTDSKNILSANYADACLFQIDTSQMKNPVYSFITCIPGSKEKLAKEYRYNQEVCADVAANAMNFILQHGIKPVVLKSMVVCGNYNHEQLYLMAQMFKRICEENKVLFAGMEISSQPINFTTEEYMVNATVIGVQDRDKLLANNYIKKGDVLIGIKSDGIESTSFPFVKLMLDRKPELYHAKIDEKQFFLDELMKANSVFTKEILELQEQGYLHKAFRIDTTLLNQKCWKDIQDGLGACIDLSAIPVLPLYQFLFEQDMLGEHAFIYHFNMGIGMIVAVPEEHWKEAIKIIGKYSECWRIGEIEADDKHKGEKVWCCGKISWY